MPVSTHTHPVFTIVCGNPECLGPYEGGPATDEDGRTRFFETTTDARDWAITEGWTTRPELCPPCASDARDRADQAAEIAAAIQYAVDNPA
jgi:hypothetical protein